ncbi:MAG: DUF2085 domain-containing protein, partial [Pseudomonadota bacterium]
VSHVGAGRVSGCRRPWCNRRPCTAPHIFGQPFILCWRCTAFAGAALAVFIALSLTLPTYTEPVPVLTASIIAGLVLVATIANAVDGWRSRSSAAASTNTRRAFLGATAGAAVACAVKAFA